MNQQHRIEVIGNLVSSNPSDSQWKKVPGANGTIELCGTQETFHLTHAFQGAPTSDVYGVMEHMVKHVTNGVNVNILCAGYTDFTVLASKVFQTIVQSPDPSDRHFTATAVHVTSEGVVSSVFDPKAKPSVALWSGDSGLFITGITSSITCTPDIDSFFASPMLSSEITVIVAEVFQLIEPRKNTRSTVTIVYIPDNHFANAWNVMESEINMGSAPGRDNTNIQPLIAVMRHVLYGSGHTACVVNLRSEHQSIPASLKKLRTMNQLMQINSFPTVQHYTIPTAAIELGETLRQRYEGGKKYLDDLYAHGSGEGFDVAIRGITRQLTMRKAIAKHSLESVLAAINSKGHSRLKVARDHRTQAQENLQKINEDYRYIMNGLQECNQQQRSIEKVLKDLQLQIAEKSADLVSQKSRHNEVKQRLRAVEDTIAKEEQQTDEEMVKTLNKIEELRETIRQADARYQEYMCIDEQDAADFNSSQSVDYFHEVAKKKDTLQELRRLHAELKATQLNFDSCVDVVGRAADDVSCAAVMEVSSRVLVKERELEAIMNEIKILEDTMNHVQPGASQPVQDFGTLQDISLLIQQPPTARTNNSHGSTATITTPIYAENHHEVPLHDDDDDDDVPLAKLTKAAKPKPKAKAPAAKRTRSKSAVDSDAGVPSTPKKAGKTLETVTKEVDIVPSSTPPPKRRITSAAATPTSKKTVATPKSVKKSPVLNTARRAEEKAAATKKGAATPSKADTPTVSAKKRVRKVEVAAPLTEESPVGIWARRKREQEKERSSTLRSLFPEAGPSPIVAALFKEAPDAKKVRKARTAKA